MRFQGRIALITAGGRGIGRATAEIIGREGGTVVLVDTDKAALDEAAGAIRKGGGSAHTLVADALDAAQVESTVERVVQEHTRIDILVNAVGGSTIIGKPAAAIDELSLGACAPPLHCTLPLPPPPVVWGPRGRGVDAGARSRPVCRARVVESGRG